jgi:hypothetical protein
MTVDHPIQHSERHQQKKDQRCLLKQGFQDGEVELVGDSLGRER